MPVLTYITTCKGRLAHLKQSLPRVAGQPEIACIVVDYSCPDGTGDWVAENFPQVSVVRVDGEQGFNASRARNLGAQAAATPWLGFFDADVLLAEDFGARVVASLQAGHYYRAAPVTLQTWGSVICQRSDFQSIGGYDEAFDGWGGEDDDLLARLDAFGSVASSFPGALLGEVAHGDDLRVRFHGLKDRRVQRQVNVLYSLAKMDLMRLTSRPLAFDLRRNLFDEARRTVTRAIAEGQPSARLELSFPAQAIVAPAIQGREDRWQLERKLIYGFSLVVQGDPTE